MTEPTSLVYNGIHSKQLGLQPYYYRWRQTNPIFSPYQTQKIIQHTVRIPGSLYTANKSALTVYSVIPGKYGVCWNQMSDRPIPSVQPMTVPTGSNNSRNSRHHSVTSSRPGCQTPGGVGCDIKHNSYERYLNRIKGKGPMRGQTPNYNTIPIPFNCAFPIYGNKTVKTGIINGCNCI